MMGSIWEDFKYNITRGTKLNQIILINVSVFILLLFSRIVINIVQGSGLNSIDLVVNQVALHTDLAFLIRHPWILVTHMFTHIGVWHLIWNLVTLYWFGNIVGDLLGDKFIWKIYLFAGLIGAAVILVFSKLFHYPSDQLVAYGASAAVMGFVAAATVIAPDYLMHLIIIGSVKLKYVALVIILLDLVGLAENSNTGGHLGHLGGAFGGAIFIWLLRSNLDWFVRKPAQKGKIIPLRSKVEVGASTKSSSSFEKAADSKLDKQAEIDRILDKIRAKGMDSLTKDEKEWLEKGTK